MIKLLQDQYPESFQFIKAPHLHNWYNKYNLADHHTDALFDGGKTSNAHAQIIPVELLAAIDDFILHIIAAQVEVDCSIMQDGDNDAEAGEEEVFALDCGSLRTVTLAAVSTM